MISSNRLDPILSAEAMKQRPVIGWREYLSLPDLGIACIKGKIDTGARTSAIHAFDLEFFGERTQEKVRFKIQPTQGDSSHIVTAEALLLEHRQVKNSGGHSELRPVISTTVETDHYRWPIELTLTNRSSMGFRMLLGREAVRQRFLVDPGSSFLLSQNPN